jgi:hypothetical protein
VDDVSHGRAAPPDLRAVIAELTVWDAVAGVFAVASFLVVFVFRIGPVVLVLSQRYGHGVHLGDLLIGVPFGLVSAAAALVAVLGSSRAPRLFTR